VVQTHSLVPEAVTSGFFVHNYKYDKSKNKFL
jgi:hypothetical protein